MKQSFPRKMSRSFLLALLTPVLIFIISADATSAATYNVPAQGSLSSVCGQATNRGDVINVATGNFSDGGQCYLSPGVKIIGAGKGSSIINVSASPYIVAESNLPVIDGSNEISGITFNGNGGNMIILSSGRSNQKIHDIAINNASDGVLIRGKEPAGDWGCENGTPSRSATFCYNFPKNSHQPEEGDWVDGIEFYNNNLTNANLKPHTIRGAKIHDNVIDNSGNGRSGVGWTSFWWSGVDFYSNRIVMDSISWTHIAMEVWMIENNTKFRDNWTNGWFSLLDNPNGPNIPYSWQITGNTFSSNVPRGDVPEALETSYTSSNVLIANNLFENTGSNDTYRVGIAIWGTGPVNNYTVRNNVFKNIDDGIEINTGDNTTTILFSGSNISIFNNTFDVTSAGVYVSDGRGTLDGLRVANNLFLGARNGSLILYPAGHDVRNVEYKNNNAWNGSQHFVNYGGSGTVDSSNINVDPGFAEGYKLSSNSSLIDKGINVGQQFSGSSPDIGANEYGLDIRIGADGSGSDPDNGDTGGDGGGSCNSLAFVRGTADPSSISANSAYTISCDYGLSNIRSVGAKNDIGVCAWKGWSGISAQFQCNSGEEGLRKNSCFLISGTEENHCPITNSINDVAVIAERKYGISDFAALVSNWMKRSTDSAVDLNADGIINIRDLGIMMSKWE